MAPGQIGEGPSGSSDTSVESGTQGSVADADATDTSYAFPQDFESLGDEPLGGDAAPQGDEQAPAQTGKEQAPPADQAPPRGQAQPPQPPNPAAAAPKPGTQQAAPSKPGEAKPPAQQPARQQGDAQRPPVAPPGPRQVAERLTANRDQLVQSLAADRFKVVLTDAEKTALDKDAIAALPDILSRLGAHLYYEMAITSLNQINNFVPLMAQNMIASTSTFDRAENAFFSKWTNIDRSNADHIKAVSYFSDSYRKMNPQATEQQAIDEVGRTVSAYLGLAAPPARGNGGPSARPQNNGTRPFAPAGTSGAPPVPGTRQTAQDPWSGMGQEFDG